MFQDEHVVGVQWAQPKGGVFPHVLCDHTQRFKRDHNLMVFAIQTVFCHDTNVAINSKAHLDAFIISNENKLWSERFSKKGRNHGQTNRTRIGR